MKNNALLLGLFFSSLGFSTANAQVKLSDNLLGAVQKGITGFTFSDADAAALSKAAIAKMDAENEVASASDPYTIRLNKIFGKHASGKGLTLNYKVYKLKEVNAFATADGSVRVYTGLMDIMDDNELLAVIGHEIGHVVNNDSRDAIKAAYKKEALIDAASSQYGKIAEVNGSQLGKIGNAMIDSSHSRMQESEADTFSYDFMKKNGYDVNAVESAFSILAKMSEGTASTFLDRMMSSHPDAKERAENAKKRAQSDGLYKAYVKQSSVAKESAKTTAKKPAKKKKK